MAMACSAVVMVLPCGVFITTTPRAVADRISTLSTPIPARPTTFNRVAASRSSFVTLVAERIARPSYSPMMARSSAGDRPGFRSTSIPRLRKISTAAGDSLSLINTLGIGVLTGQERTWQRPGRRPSRATAAAPGYRRFRPWRRPRCAEPAARRDRRRCRRPRLAFPAATPVASRPSPDHPAATR